MMLASKLKPYPGEYKTQFGQWARLPSHWEEANLAKLSTRITDGSHYSPETQDEGENYISVKDIDEWGEIDFENCKKISLNDFNKLSDEGNQPRVGSLLITKDGTIGRAAIVNEPNDFVILSSVGLIEPNETKILSSFLRYFLISQVGTSQMYSMIAGSALTRLTVEKINWIRAPLPSIKEQEKIVSFIQKNEEKFRQTLGSLRTKQKALEEKRSSLITQAVTKGLNPDVPMKETGLDWYPEVPSHWKLRRVKHIATISPSNVDKKKYDGQEEVRLANYVDVYHNDRITEKLALMVATASDNEIAKFSLKAGDLIITKDSETWDDIAVPAFVPKQWKELFVDIT